MRSSTVNWIAVFVLCLSLVGCKTLAKDRKALVGTWEWELTSEELWDGAYQGAVERQAFEEGVREHERRLAEMGDDHAGHDHGADDHAGHDHGADDHAGHDHGADEPAGDAPVEAPAEAPEEPTATGTDDAPADEITQVAVEDLVAGQVPRAVVRQTFNEDGTYRLQAAGQSYVGSWDMPDQRGSRRVVVVAFEQQGIPQRLVMWVTFLDDQRIEIADEAGVAKIFLRR